MLSDDRQIYSLELIVQDLIRKYNLRNGSETHRPIPVTELINAILQVINDTTTAKSREICDMFATCGFFSAEKAVWAPKLMGWLELHPTFTVIGDKVGLSRQADCAHQQLEEMFIQLILNEDPQNGIVPLPYFMNLLNRMFLTNEYDYELFSNCGFLKFATPHEGPLPSEGSSSRKTPNWLY